MSRSLSLLDPGGVQKDTHSEHAHAIRIQSANSQVPGGYSKVDFTKNVLGSITQAIFYRGETAQKTRVKFFGDIAGSLLGKYWLINSAEDAVNYYIWYNDGTAIDPALTGFVGLEIPINTNDPASIVCLATKRIMQGCLQFNIETNGNDVLLLENVTNGFTTPSVDVNTGFGVTTTCTGITKRISSLELPQEVGIKYVFNYGERKFEIVVDATSSLSGILVSDYAIQNVPAAVAGTEYSFTLIAGVKRFEVKARSGNAKVQLARIAGQSGITYRTVTPGNVFSEPDLILLAPLTFYFQTNKDNETIEILTWF
jgi:hypothetical protein